MLILYVLLSPKHLTQDQNHFPNFLVLAVLIFQNWQWPVDRVGRPDVHRLCTSISRPQRSTDLFVLLSGKLGRPRRSTVGPQRSEFWPLAVDRPGRPDSVRFSDRFQQLVFLTDSFCWFDSNGFLRLFLTPINRRSLQMIWLMILELSRIFLQEISKDFQALSFRQDFLSKAKIPITQLEAYISTSL